MRKMTIAALLVATTAPTPSLAQNGTPIHVGNGLNDDCQSSETVPKVARVSYIMGVLDTINGIAFCAPAGVTYGQEIDIVKNGLTQHPEERQEQSGYLIYKYLHAVWPCPTKAH